MAREAEALVSEFCRVVAGILARLLRKSGAVRGDHAKEELAEGKK
jgi:hypothetical protein